MQEPGRNLMLRGELRARSMYGTEAVSYIRKTTAYFCQAKIR